MYIVRVWCESPGAGGADARTSDVFTGVGGAVLTPLIGVFNCGNILLSSVGLSVSV
jgi:hypothetical protein